MMKPGMTVSSIAMPMAGPTRRMRRSMNRPPSAPAARAVGKRNRAPNTAEPTQTMPATICTKRSQTTTHLRCVIFGYTYCIAKWFPREGS